MKYYDTNGSEIDESTVDLNQGSVKTEQRLVAHHDATPEVPEQSHWEIIKEDDQGFKAEAKIIDVPYQPAKDAYDEYETVGVYTLYTLEELAENAKRIAEKNRVSMVDSQSHAALMMLIASKASALSDEQVSQVDAMFPDWQAGVSYHTGDVVRYTNSLWRALQDSTGQEQYSPDVFTSGWKRIGDPDDDGVFPWSQPLGATDAYRKGDKVTYNGVKWTSTVDYNVWKPGVYGWAKDGSTDTTIDAGSDEWPDFVQPTGAKDAYKTGDKITYNGKHYVSTIDANVWSPDTYPQGWKTV